MGFIETGSTVTATAYLTELGRKILFNKSDTPRYVQMANGSTIDRLKITSFGLADSDVNYRIYDSSSTTVLPLPDLTGENEGAIKGTKGRIIENLISPGDTNLPKEGITSVVYKATKDEVVWDLSQDLASLPTVITQQLMSYVDGQLATDGLYLVNPTNYGKKQSVNGELIITLAEPTSISPGYRIRIFTPSSGVNSNKWTLQFEKSNPVVPSNIVINFSQIITPTP